MHRRQASTSSLYSQPPNDTSDIVAEFSVERADFCVKYLIDRLARNRAPIKKTLASA